MRLLPFTITVFAILTSCTGFNYLVITGVVPNTNPAKEYSTQMPLKGGLVYHHNSSIGQAANHVEILKVSEPACAKSILNLIAWGDASIETAKKSVQISKIASTEFRTRAILALVYHEQCIIVQGE